MNESEWTIKKGASTLTAEEAVEIKMKFLINIVKGSPFIYDPNNYHYKYTANKVNYWERIAKIMNYSNGRQVLKIWDRLIYEFTLNAKRQKMIKQGILNKPKEPWKYMLEMKFLLPHIKGVTEDDLSDKEEPLEESDIERLIIEVKNTPVIYDPLHPDYQYFLARDYNWVVVANKFKKCSVATVKETWRIIKNTYLRVLNRNTSSEHRPLLKYKYEEQMQFLLPSLNAQHFEVDDIENEKSFYKNDESNASANCEQIEQDVRVEEVTQAGNIIRNEPVTAESDEPQQSDNSMYHFFMSIYNSTNEMPASLQLQMMKKIFDAVTNAEEIWWESNSDPSFRQSFS